MDLKKTRKRINKKLSQVSLIFKQLKEEKQNLKEAQLHLINTEEAQTITQHVAEGVQQQAHARISKVVSSCLETVFDGEERYGFKIRFERKRGKTDAVLILIKDGHEVDDPMEADSGGALDVASFALRLSSIVLSKPRLRKFIAMDEPFKFVSPIYRNNVKLMLEGLAKDFGFQLIMVTHIKEIETGRVLRL